MTRASSIGAWRHGCPLSWGEHEALDRDVGVDVVGAEEGEHVASGDLFDSVGEIVAHCGLVGPAEVEHEIGAAVANEAALPLGSRSRTTTVTRSAPKLVRAFVGPRPVYSLISRPTWLAIASPDGPVAVGSKVGLAIASSVLASLLKAESHEKEGDG